MNRTVTTNHEQQVYVIPAGKDGYSCLGFDVLLKRLTALADELNIRIKPQVRGSMTAYELYQFVVECARNNFEKTGWRSKSELYAPFIGHEGKRVEVEYNNGEKERFYIGKSTGFIPCHLAIKKINSSGGCAVLNDFIKSWKIIGNKTRR